MTTPPTEDSDPAVMTVVSELGITSVRHFTTNRGLLGTLSLRRLLSRAELADDLMVDLIAMNNCFKRWDSAWFSYVNLSLQHINGWLYGISSGKWHNGEDLWWVVLDFDPIVLSHPGVVFVTTNNGYTTAKRAEGAQGLRALWGPEIVSMKFGRPQVLTRAGKAFDQPTDPQCEALYPQAVSTQWLRTIFVGDPALVDSVEGYLAATGHPPVSVVYDPEAFS